MDRELARNSSSGSFPTGLSTAASRIGRAHHISRSSSDRTTAGRPRLPTGLRVETGTALSAARRGARLVGHASRRRPGRDARFLRHARWHAAAPRADPAGRQPGERVEMQLHDLKISPRSDDQALGASRRRGRQSRAGGDGRNHGLDRRACRPAPAQAKPAARPNPAAARHCPGSPASRSRSSTSSIRSIPSTGELIPAQPDGYLTANHLWDAAESQDHASRRTERVRRVSDLARAVRSRRARSSPSWFSTGPAGKTIQVEFGRYHRVATKRRPMPDPIVPLSLPARTHPPASRTRACTSRSMFPTTWRPAIIPAR